MEIAGFSVRDAGFPELFCGDGEDGVGEDPRFFAGEECEEASVN